MRGPQQRFAFSAAQVFIASTLLVGSAVLMLGGCSNGGGSQVAPSGTMQQQSAARFGMNEPPSTVVVSSRTARTVSADGIIYTPTNVVIENSSYDLDLNHDGTTDFTFIESNTKGMGCRRQTDHYGRLDVSAVQSGGGVETDSNGYALALSGGSPIGQGQGILSGSAHIETDFSIWYRDPNNGLCQPLDGYGGYWSNTTAYLGLAFPIQGKTHYGWAQLAVGAIAKGGFAVVNATLKGYAYQTKADKSIMAGQK